MSPSETDPASKFTIEQRRAIMREAHLHIQATREDRQRGVAAEIEAIAAAELPEIVAKQQWAAPRFHTTMVGSETMPQTSDADPELNGLSSTRSGDSIKRSSRKSPRK